MLSSITKVYIENKRLAIIICDLYDEDYTEEIVDLFKKRHRAKVKKVLEGPDIIIYIIIIDNQEVNVVFDYVYGTSINFKKKNETLIKKLKDSIEERLKEID